MFDIYQSRRKPQYELVVPHGTNIETYDKMERRLANAFGRLKTRGGKNSRASRRSDAISAGETGISSEKWTRWMVDRQPNARSPAKAAPMRCFGAGAARQRPNHVRNALEGPD